MGAPVATAAPIDMKLFSGKTHAIQVEGPSTPLSANSVEIKHYHNVYPVMRTLSRDEYHVSAIQRNQEYQSQLAQIHDIADKSLELGESQGDHAHLQHLADSAYVGACTAKVVGDLEDINAYHRGMMQEAMAAYEEGVVNPQRHVVNLLELRQAQQEARSLRIYSDFDILRTAEEHCHPTTMLASMRATLSHSNSALSSQMAAMGDLLD